MHMVGCRPDSGYPDRQAGGVRFTDPVPKPRHNGENA